MPLYRNFVDFVSNQVISGIKNFTQNLGLGISTPQSKLHIDSGDATASNIKFTAGATTGQSATDGFDIGIDSIGAARISQAANRSLILATNNISRLLVSGGGIVTINSTQPSTASNNGALVISNGGLGVNGNINVGATINAPFFVTNQITCTTFTPANAAGTNNAGINTIIRGGAATGNAIPGAITFFTSDVGAPGTTVQSNTEKMRLSSAGNLLVGATTDNGTDKVQVNGTCNFVGGLTITGNTSIPFIHHGAAVIGSTALSSQAQLLIVNRATNIVPIIARGISLQSANLQQWQSNTGAILASVDASGIITAPIFRQSPTWAPPATATSPGVAGEFGSDSNFYYYCWSNNNWKRAALSTW